MNACNSVLLTACWISAFLGITFGADQINCKLPDHFELRLSSILKTHLYESNLTIQIDTDALTITSYTGKNAIHMQADDVVISFNSFMYPEYEDPARGDSAEPQTISEKYTGRITGLAQRQLLNTSDIDGCRVVLLSTERNRPGVTTRIANEIHRLAESCIELEVCEKMSTLKPQYMASSTGDNVFDIMSGCPDSVAIIADGCEEYYNSDTVQPIVNKVVDVAIAEIIEKLRVRNTSSSTISVPNIDTDFHTSFSIFKTDGRFIAENGTFRDLTTIHRISDVRLSHDGMKLMAACEFGLDIADLNYAYYNLKYGIMKMDGRLASIVNDTAVAIRIAVDYNSKPCLMSMDHLKVTKMGNVNIDMTGLGPINSMVSELLRWITITWRDEIVGILEKELRATVQEQLSTFDCEKYRP